MVLDCFWSVVYIHVQSVILCPGSHCKIHVVTHHLKSFFNGYYKYSSNWYNFNTCKHDTFLNIFSTVTTCSIPVIFYLACKGPKCVCFGIFFLKVLEFLEYFWGACKESIRVHWIWIRELLTKHLTFPGM